MVEMVEMVEVKVPVRADRVFDFYGYIAGFEGAITSGNGGAGSSRAWRREDGLIARDVVGSLTGDEKRFLRLISERGSEAIPYRDVEDELAVEQTARIGLQRGIGVETKKRGRCMPWTTGKVHRTVTMPPLVADLFRPALGETE